MNNCEWFKYFIFVVIFIAPMSCIILMLLIGFIDKWLGKNENI